MSPPGAAAGPDGARSRPIRAGSAQGLRLLLALGLGAPRRLGSCGKGAGLWDGVLRLAEVWGRRAAGEVGSSLCTVLPAEIPPQPGHETPDPVTRFPHLHKERPTALQGGAESKREGTPGLRALLRSLTTRTSASTHCIQGPESQRACPKPHSKTREEPRPDGAF